MQIECTLTQSEGWWVAEVPFLEIATQGESRDDAVAMTIDAIQETVRAVFDKEISISVGCVQDNFFTLSFSDIPTLTSLALKNLRSSSGMTVRQLAGAVGTKGPNTVGQYERGIHEPSLTKLQKFLNAMGKDIKISIVDR